MSSRNSDKEENGRVSYAITEPRKSQLSPSLALKDNENSISMIKLALLPILALAITLCSVFGSSRAAPDRTTACQSDNECAEGQYCYIKYGPSYCTDCLDCGSYNRKHGIGQCAKGRAECGECLPGFIQLGIQCSQNAEDIITSKYSNSGYIPPNNPTSAHAAIQNSIFEVKNIGNINHTGEFQSDHGLMPAGHNIWIVISASTVLSVLVVTGLVVMYCRRPLVMRAGPRNKDEEMELQPISGTCSNQNPGDGDQGPTADLIPSAPPEEYLQNPPYWPGSYENPGRTHNTLKGQNFTERIQTVNQMVDFERKPESYQQANPFSAGNAAGEEAQAFVAQLDQEAMDEHDPDAVLELIENELHEQPLAVEPPPQQVPEVDPENPVAAVTANAGNNLNEESMDLGEILQDGDDMDIDEGAQGENNEVFVQVRLDLVAAVIPVDGQGNDPVGRNAHNNESRNDSGIVSDDDDNDAVVPGSPTFSRTASDSHENNPTDGNINNHQNRRPLIVDQSPVEIASQLRNQFNIQVVNPENWMVMRGNEEGGHYEE